MNIMLHMLHCVDYMRWFFTIINITQVVLRNFKIHPASQHVRDNRGSIVSEAASNFSKYYFYSRDTSLDSCLSNDFRRASTNERHVNNDSFRVTKFRADTTLEPCPDRARYTSIVSSIPSTSFEEDKVSRESNI